MDSISTSYKLTRTLFLDEGRVPRGGATLLGLREFIDYKTSMITDDDPLQGLLQGVVVL